ncbi:hypothetical protein [Microbacterium sp. 179-I 3D3 NHS]|uniref:hypothetical protein n=1 Tax=unclassified Microbacterium TaxID=2609290 RepID=UPI0039A195BF
MEIVESIGAVGEVIGWVGLLVGIPLLVIGLLVRAAQGPHTRTAVAVIDDLDDRPMALWSAGGRTCTRPLTAAEARHLAERPDPFAYVSDRDPERMRVEARSASERACTTIALVMLGAALLGFAASFLPVLAG